MIDLPYSLVIEATEAPDFFGFFSPELEGFTGIGHSIEDCLYQARWAMKDHVELMEEKNLSVPPKNESPTVTIRNDRKKTTGKKTTKSKRPPLKKQPA